MLKPSTHGNSYWEGALESSTHGWSGPFSEQIPSELRVPSKSEPIPGKFRAKSEQASQTLYFLVILCNESLWLADNKEHIRLGVKPTMRGATMNGAQSDENKIKLNI